VQEELFFIIIVTLLIYFINNNYVLFQYLVAVDHLPTEFVPQLNPNPETPFNQNYPFTNLLRNINCGQNVTVKVWE
jgi:hypothetical protein